MPTVFGHHPEVPAATRRNTDRGHGSATHAPLYQDALSGIAKVAGPRYGAGPRMVSNRVKASTTLRRPMTAAKAPSSKDGVKSDFRKSSA
jgi:hypothetical protein